MGRSHITILGGGLAGLSVGYYAKKKRIPFTLYEEGNQIGGNCITLKYKEFLFDSGAHRFHDKYPEVTGEIKKLLGEDLKKINAPSQIYLNGKFIDFPPSPLNLLKNLGLHTSIKAGYELAKLKLMKIKQNKNRSFKTFAINTYGKTIAEYFLLNHSEKLWGKPADKLSSCVAGKRLKGLNFKTFIKEAILGKNAKTEHLDGSFYYPKHGIGTIAKKIEEFCGRRNISKNSKITKIIHNHSQIKAIEINEENIINVNEIVSTLPLPFFLQIMKPSPPKKILLLAKNLHYRNLVSIVFFLNKESITENASIYFPTSDFPFTRVYEPKNRSIYMSPPRKTSLVAEIPCQQEDIFWNMNDKKLIEFVFSKFLSMGWIKKEEIINAQVHRINYAYPLLEIGFEKKIEKIMTYLKRFNNLKVSGRNGKFMYTHIHDMMKFGKDIIEEF